MSPVEERLRQAAGRTPAFPVDERMLAEARSLLRHRRRHRAALLATAAAVVPALTAAVAFTALTSAQQTSDVLEPSPSRASPQPADGRAVDARRLPPGPEPSGPATLLEEDGGIELVHYRAQESICLAVLDAATQSLNCLPRPKDRVTYDIHQLSGRGSDETSAVRYLTFGSVPAVATAVRVTTGEGEVAECPAIAIDDGIRFFKCSAGTRSGELLIEAFDEQGSRVASQRRGA